MRKPADKGPTLLHCRCRAHRKMTVAVFSSCLPTRIWLLGCVCLFLSTTSQPAAGQSALSSHQSVGLHAPDVGRPGSPETGEGFVPSGRMCEEGGYCSVGHSKFWTGDIGTSEKLKEMLDAVSYKKEIIITPLSSADEQTVWLDPILQLHWELEEAGYAHFVVHTTAAATCAQLHKFRNVSCIWDGMPSLKGHSNNRHGIWYMRWKFFARAGRMGYNVMNVDGDTIFFRDPYVHIKRKPMSDINMWCNPEGGGPMHCNGGFMYIQNLRPDGPISWIFKMVVDDQMWMMDDGYAYVKQMGGRGGECHSYDQELIYDAVKTAFVGRPVPYDYFVDCRNESWTIVNRLGVTMTKQQVLENLRTMMGKSDSDYRNNTQVIAPEDFFPPGLDTNEFVKQLVNRVTVPNLAYGYPEELGGRLGPEKKGPYTQQWIDTLKSDCPECPWWNEIRPIKDGKDNLEQFLGPYLNGTGGKFINEFYWDKDQPVELIAVGPAWLSNSLGGFRTGTWTGRGEQGIGHLSAMSHVHHWPAISSWHKNVVRKLVGRYNWTLGAMTTFNGSTPYTSGYPVHRTLALHPSIDLSRTRSLEEYNRIVMGLMQVAQLTHRTVVFPDVPCEAPWLHGNDGKGTNNRVCKVPTNFPENRWPEIWSMPYAIDPKTRQLVGGWTRRLMSSTARKLRGWFGLPDSAFPGQTDASPNDPNQPQPPNDAAAPIIYYLDPKNGLPTLKPPSAAPTQDSDDIGEGEAAGVAGAPRRRGLRHVMRRLLGALYRTRDQQINFWKDKKFMFSISWLADFECTREIGNPGGIMMHELAYWMTTPAAATAKWEPDATNTVLSLAPGPPGDALRIQPIEDPQYGYVRQPLAEHGWSIADYQVLLPLGQVVREVSRFAHQPLVYLGHPVALISSEERHKRGDTMDHGHAKDAAEAHIQQAVLNGDPTPSATSTNPAFTRKLARYEEAEFNGPKGKLIGDAGWFDHNRPLSLDMLNNMLGEVTSRISNSQCKVTWATKRGWEHENLDLKFPKTQLGIVRDHHIRQLHK